MDKRVFILSHAEARRRAMDCVSHAPEGYVVTVAPPKRTLDQNAAQWPILEGYAGQLDWPVDGSRVKITPEDWKDLLTAAFRRETQRVAMGLDGGMVLLGMRTSKMSKQEFSEYLEFLHSVAANRGVDLERQK